MSRMLLCQSEIMKRLRDFMKEPLNRPPIHLIHTLVWDEPTQDWGNMDAPKAGFKEQLPSAREVRSLIMN